MIDTNFENDDPLKLYDQSFSSRLLLGSAHYPSLSVMQSAIQKAKPAMITAALRRMVPMAQHSSTENSANVFFDWLQAQAIPVLPNTAGCYEVNEAITTAQMARELFNTAWIKLELIGDTYTLQPDLEKLLVAARELLSEGFKVLPYCTEDLIVCHRLLEMGCQALMPWAAPIGSGQGPVNAYGLQLLRQRLPRTPLIIDAGLGLPSHVTQVMEWGFDGVLLNSAVSGSGDPSLMAQAFADATRAGRAAYHAKPMPKREIAHASTPIIGTPFWHQDSHR